MEGPINAEELSKLFGILAFGFVFRWAYGTRRCLQKEEHPVTLTWAIVWSGILNELYKHSPLVFALKDKNANLGLTFFVNLGVSLALGILAGHFSLAVRVSHKSLSTHKFKRRVTRFLAALFDPRVRDFSSLADRHLNLVCKGRWVVVECKDKRTYWAEIIGNDARWSESYTVTLGQVREVNQVSGEISTTTMPEIHIKSDDIAFIKPYIPKGAPPRIGKMAKLRSWAINRWKSVREKASA
jgi:hypothetical protein